ncbi:hypothetical protein GEMRC1_002663 [Eukaryota sp. GEM-RC1]
MSFNEYLANNNVILADGGTMFEMESRGYNSAGRWIPECVLEEPEAVEQMHKEFADAGAEIIQCINFYAHQQKAKQIGYDIDIHKLNNQAMRLARNGVQRSQQKFNRSIFLAGGLSPISFFIPQERSADIIAETFKDQIRSQASEADVIFAETFYTTEEAKLAIRAAKSQGVQVICTIHGDRSTIKEDMETLISEDPLGIGLNCYHGPKPMLEMMNEIHKRVRVPEHIHLACQPVGYDVEEWEQYPGFPIAMEKVQITRMEAAKFARNACDLGIKVIGGCCGFRPVHIRAMCTALGKQCRSQKFEPEMQYSRFPGVKQRVGDYWSRFE